MESVFEREKRAFVEKARKQKHKMEELYRKQSDELDMNRTKECNERVERETKHFLSSIEHLENELNLVKEQKKEIESQNQVLELKSLSLKPQFRVVSKRGSSILKLDFEIQFLFSAL